MVGLPALLRAFSLEDIGRAIQRASGTALDFTPTHALATVRSGVAYDLNRDDPWDLYSEGSEAVAGRSTIGQAAGFVHTTLETIEFSTQMWVARSLAAFNFASQPWVVLYPWRYDELANGGLIMGNNVGPNPDDPLFPSIWYGANRGWGPSSNLDGGFGFLMHGSLGHHNTDTIGGSYSAADGRWRMMALGNNPAAKTSWMTCALRRDEIATQIAAGLAGATYGVSHCAMASAAGVGDITSPDRFRLGEFRYGVRQQRQNGAIGLPMVVLENDAALNFWLYRFTSIMEVLQAQLEAAGG